ncbi:MAG: hypothetical protein ABW039_08145 [Sphingobium sp.]
MLSTGLLPAQGVVAQGEGSKPETFDAVPADAGQPFGGIAISPTRLVMDARRGGQVMLYNSSTAPVSYRVESLDLSIDETGAHSPVADGAIPAWSALPHIRYAPRQVTLQPGQRQAIKVIARVPADVAAGEYRSHLRFSSIPTVAPVEEAAEEKPGQDRMVSVTVGMDFRVTIPLLLRVGETTGGARIERSQVVSSAENRRAVNVTVARTGNRSDYGTLRIMGVDGAVLGSLRGVSVPAPLGRRIFPVALTGTAKPASVAYVEELPGMRDGDVLAQAAID